MSGVQGVRSADFPAPFKRDSSQQTNCAVGTLSIERPKLPESRKRMVSSAVLVTSFPYEPGHEGNSFFVAWRPFCSFVNDLSLRSHQKDEKYLKNARTSLRHTSPATLLSPRSRSNNARRHTRWSRFPQSLQCGRDEEENSNTQVNHALQTTNDTRSYATAMRWYTLNAV